jgi:hypothetical protein
LVGFREEEELIIEEGDLIQLVFPLVELGLLLDGELGLDNGVLGMELDLAKFWVVYCYFLGG